MNSLSLQAQSEPLNRLCSDFGLIAPEELASIFNIGVSLANVQTANAACLYFFHASRPHCRRDLICSRVRSPKQTRYNHGIAPAFVSVVNAFVEDKQVTRDEGWSWQGKRIVRLGKARSNPDALPKSFA